MRNRVVVFAAKRYWLAGNSKTAKLQASTLADVEDPANVYLAHVPCVRKGAEPAGTRREMEYLSPGIGIA